MAPRVGLTPDRIVDAAAEIADRDGYGALTLGGVASALGVRGPSLYNHVEGLDDIRRRLAVRAIEQLGAVLQRAAVGRSGRDALRAVARAYRAFAHEHPGMYAATVPASADDDLRRAAARVVETAVAVLVAFGLDEDEAVHAARSVRAAVHGFVDLELAGGFGLAQAPDDSFEWMVTLVADGLARPRADRVVDD